MKVNLRSGTKNDLIRMVEIYNDANLLFDEAYRSLGNESTFSDIIEKDNVVIGAIEDVDIAFVSYNIVDNVVLISGLYVICEYQRKGIGRCLMDDVLKSLSNVDYVILKALKLATWAILFYSKYGFINVDNVSLEVRDYILNYIKRSNHSEVMVLKTL
ncbi:GNAT family N-acetyltransferase [Fusibacter sp. JL298sf-3]